MPPLVEIKKLYKGKRFDTDAIKRDLRNAMKREGRETRALLNSTTQHWDGIRPKFVYRTVVDSRVGVIGVVVLPVGTKEEINKWWRLNDGTSIRYATMQKGYIRKTSPNRLATRAGSKGRPYVRKSKTQPGIKPRNWTRIVANKRQPVMRREITSIVRGATKP